MESSLKHVAWNKNTSYALRLYKLITQSLGLWPLNHSHISSTVFFYFNILIQITMAVSLVGEVHSGHAEFDQIIQSGMLVTFNLLIILKLIILNINHDNMFTIISSAVDEWQSIKDSNIFGIMKKHAKIGRYVCITQMFSAYFVNIAVVLGPIASRMLPLNETLNVSLEVYQPLPLQTNNFYGEMSSFSYAAVYLLQVIQLYMTCTANIGCDCYFFGIALHIAGQFNCLAYEYENFYVNQDDKIIKQKLSSLINKHNEYLKFAKCLEETFNAILLFQLSLNIIQIVLIGMQMILNLGFADMTALISNVISYCILNLQIFLYSYAGDRLSSEISNLKNAIYFSSWYNLSPKLNKNLIFIMIKTNRVFNLTAGKIFFINIETSRSIFKATFSFFSLLRTMVND